MKKNRKKIQFADFKTTLDIGCILVKGDDVTARGVIFQKHCKKNNNGLNS